VEMWIDEAIFFLPCATSSPPGDLSPVTGTVSQATMTNNNSAQFSIQYRFFYIL